MRLLQEKYINIKFAFFSLFISLIIYLLTIFFNINLFRPLSNIFINIEKHKRDQFFIVIIIILIGVIIDFRRYKKKKMELIVIQKHRLDTLKSTMHTVNDIVNNFLQTIVFCRGEIKEDKLLDPETLKMLDTAINQTTGRLKKLEELEVVKEIELTKKFKTINYD